MTMYIEIWVFALSLLAALLVGGLIGYLCRLGITREIIHKSKSTRCISSQQA